MDQPASVMPIKKSSKTVWFLIIFLLAIVVVGFCLFQKYQGSKNSELSELDRIAGVTVDLWCYNVNKESHQSEGLSTTLAPNNDDLGEINKILAKYGFKDEAELERIGLSYRGTQEFMNKTIGSEKYIECTNKAMKK